MSLPTGRTIEVIKRRWPSIEGAPDDDVPVFILSAGWRSGSTLVQRLLVSGGDILVWGEPYAISDYVGRLAESLGSFSDIYPPKEFFLSSYEATSMSDIQEQWIAHLYPDVAELRAAHRAFFMALLADPATRRGYSRWGLKECKYGIDHALFLKWLFPSAKFLFVYRNPLNAWRSFRLFGAYRRWPDDTVFSPLAFGKLWRELLQGFLAGHADVDGMMVKYEDLIDGRQSVEDLAEFAGVHCDLNVLRHDVSGRAQRRLEPVPAIEKLLLARAVEPLASNLGYRICHDGSDDT